MKLVRLLFLLVAAVTLTIAAPGDVSAEAGNDASVAVSAKIAKLAPAKAAQRVSADTTQSVDTGLYDALRAAAPRLNREVLAMALDATACARSQGQVRRDDILTVIDYSLPSTQERMWVFDLEGRTLLWEELVAHGKNTGGNYAKSFSNVNESKQTSLGLFRTGTTYHGGNGYSLRLEGLEPGINDRAMQRAIVMHGAPYVSHDFVRRVGRLGRSWGCPALSQEVARPVIDRIKEGSLVFAYYPDQDFLASSRYLASACQTGTTTRLAKAAP